MRRRRLPIARFVIGVLAGAVFSGVPVKAQAPDVGALVARAQAAVKSGDHAATVDALEQALQQARAAAPLTVKPFLLVTRPAKFYGDYTPRANAVFRGGEPLEFYLEPKNLVSSPAADGTYTPAFDVDLHVFMADVKALGTQEKFGSFRLATRSPITDIFMNLKVTLTGAPAGDYQVRFIVTDVNSKKTATVTQPITVK